MADEIPPPPTKWKHGLFMTSLWWRVAVHNSPENYQWQTRSPIHKVKNMVSLWHHFDDVLMSITAQRTTNGWRDTRPPTGWRTQLVSSSCTWHETDTSWRTTSLPRDTTLRSSEVHEPSTALSTLLVLACMWGWRVWRLASVTSTSLYTSLPQWSYHYIIVIMAFWLWELTEH